MADNPGTSLFTIRLAQRLGISVHEADRILDAVASLADEDPEGFRARTMPADKPRETRRATGFGHDSAFDLPGGDFDEFSRGEN